MMMTDEERKKNNDQLGSGTTTLSASNGTRSGTPKPTQSGSYTNLQSYIGKNKGATNQSLEKARNDFGQLRNSYTTNTSAIDRAQEQGRNTLEQARQSRNFLIGLEQDPYLEQTPYSASRRKDDVRANRTMVNPERNFLESGTQAQAANTGLTSQRNNLANINSTGGIRNYLSSIRGDRAGSAGGMNLDQFLMQSTPEANNELSQIASGANEMDLNYGSGLNSLSNEYDQLGEFDVDANTDRIGNTLRGNLDNNNQESVNIYNEVADVYGFRPTRFMGNTDYLNTGIKDFENMRGYSTIPTSPVTAPTAQTTVAPTITPTVAPTTTPTVAPTTTPTVTAGRPSQGQASRNNATMGGARPESKRRWVSTGRGAGQGYWTK